MATTATTAKRGAPATEETETKKTKVGCESNPFPSLPRHLVVLNPADCDLDFDIEGNGRRGSALCHEGFAYCWSGARANVGIIGGKYCFGCKIIQNQEVIMEETPLGQQNLCRIGISRGDEEVGNLGETKHSFGYGGTGKFSNAGNFVNYGAKFGVGDTIVCAVDLESKPASITFSKNGKSFGSLRHFDAVSHGVGRKLEWGSALFPHVLLKNVIVIMEFTPEDGLTLEEGYKPWARAIGDGNGVIGPTFSSPSECEVVMMVGLPASGKTTWAEKRIRENPEKRYVLLGTNKNLEQMKVLGLHRKYNYAERFERLIECATQILNALLPRAAKVPRNYIIDQTNVYKGARKRKLKPFADFWKVAVVVFPTPEERKIRSDKRSKEMGKDVPAEAVEEMSRNYVLPKSKDMPITDEYFDEVIFTELNRAEAERCLDEMISPYSWKALSDSPYSSASSVQLYNFSSLPTASPPPPPMNFNYQLPDQVNSACLGTAPQIGSAPNTYDYSLNNTAGSLGLGMRPATNPYSCYITAPPPSSYTQPPPPSSYTQPPLLSFYTQPPPPSSYTQPPPPSSYTQPPPPSSYTQPPPPSSSTQPPPPSSYMHPSPHSSYPPPPPISYGSLPYPATLAPTPTYGNLPAIAQPTDSGRYYPYVHRGNN